MWPFTDSTQPSTTPTLDQEFIARYWDLEGRVVAMESNIDDRLHELEKRYKRAEQAERRLDGKQADDSPCPDEPADHPAIIAMKARRGGNHVATSPRVDPTAG